MKSLGSVHMLQLLLQAMYQQELREKDEEIDALKSELTVRIYVASKDMREFEIQCNPAQQTPLNSRLSIHFNNP